MASEDSPLLPQPPAARNYARGDPKFFEAQEEHRRVRVRSAVWLALSILFVAGIVFAFADPGYLRDWGMAGQLPRHPDAAAEHLLSVAPVIDGHIDLPEVIRMAFANNLSAVNIGKPFPMHVDIPRLRKGRVGGFFWSVYVDCPNPDIEGADFLNSTWRVRDTLEQIDVATGLIDKYPDTFAFALTSGDVKEAISEGKIASLLGVEGAHQIGNSIHVLRQYHRLGVRYMTLTHICHNAFADSGGFLKPFEPLHGGLSPLGFKLVEEMNRLGVLVDLSHTSDDTARQALTHTKAPVIWSHSSARAVHDVARNVPDDILEMIGFGPNQTDAVVMVNFAPYFVAPDGEATLEAVANHVEHIARVAGKEHVGIGSDYDGIGATPVGLEDVSKYPGLIAELYRRGWNKFELAGLTGKNFLRVFEGAERAARQLQAAGATPAYDLYSKRTDIPPARTEL